MKYTCTSNGASFQGFAIPADKQSTKVPIIYDNQEYVLSHGSVVIAAITSCTNTSNPSVMLGAGQSAGATTHVLTVYAVKKILEAVNTWNKKYTYIIRNLLSLIKKHNATIFYFDITKCMKAWSCITYRAWWI